jgi:uncharacterized protein
MSQVASVLWRRLDTPGHDACRLGRRASGWWLEGAAVFRQEGAPAQLRYEALCDADWRTQEGRVHGWLGSDSRAFTITRTSEGVWTLDGVVVPGLEHCVDLDFGFTPATNLLPLRRLALDPGDAADAPAAWLNVVTGVLEPLPQPDGQQHGG